MAGIKRGQLVNMNQHYRRFSLDYFLDCQQRLGVEQIELWCGAAHFWLDHEGFGDVNALRAKLSAHNVRVVSVTAPSIAYQYQYASQEPELLERSFRYFSNAIHLAAEVGADRVVVNSGWGYCGEDEAAMWGRCRDHLGRLCLAAGREGILLVMESLRQDESNLVYSLERARRIEEEKQNKGKKKSGQKKKKDEEPDQEGVNKEDSREGIRAYARGRAYIPGRFGGVTPYQDPNILIRAQMEAQAAAKGKKKGQPAPESQAEQPAAPVQTEQPAAEAPAQEELDVQSAQAVEERMSSAAEVTEEAETQEIEVEVEEIEVEVPDEDEKKEGI